MLWRKSSQNSNDLTYSIPPEWLKLHYYEAFNILFRFENALRIFVYIILKNEFYNKWMEINIISDDELQGNILSTAKKRIKQDKDYAYLGYPVSCPLMYLTSGELIRIITDDKYWQFFNKYFLGSKAVIKNKLDEISNVRNALAHFRPIMEDDVELIKQNAKHVLTNIENTLGQLFTCKKLIASNLDEQWYKEFGLMQSENCAFKFYESEDKEWIKIEMAYNVTTAKTHKISNSIYDYVILKIDPKLILKQYKNLCSHLTCLTEKYPLTYMAQGFTPVISKHFNFKFSAKTLRNNFEVIKSDFHLLLETIETEKNLIISDVNSIGKILEPVILKARWRNQETQGKGRWYFTDDILDSKLVENDPTEYWGFFFGTENNFVSDTNRLPWTSVDISRFDDLPF
jgi:hypothetical protein